MSEEQNPLKPVSQYIAPFAGLSAPAGGNGEPSYARMLGLLRDARAEVQNLQATLNQLQQKADMVDQSTRTREIFAVIQADGKIYEYNGAQISGRLKELRALMGMDATIYDRFGDEITHIENHWERAVRSWPILPTDVSGESNIPVTEADIVLADEMIAAARQVNGHLKELVYHVGLLTIPARLNQHLEQLRIGQALDFHATFNDEISNEEDRNKILTYLAARPQAIPNGVINRDKGIIFHAAAQLSRRRRSYLYILLTVLVGAVAAWLVSIAGDTFSLADWPVKAGNTSQILVGYAFVMLGGAVHLGVDGVKQVRSAGDGAALAVEDWFTWIHIHEVDVIIGVASLWVGFFGVVLFSGTIEWQTAFLVGYSIDSFMDMFLQRFTTSMSTRASTFSI